MFYIRVSAAGLLNRTYLYYRFTTTPITACWEGQHEGGCAGECVSEAGWRSMSTNSGHHAALCLCVCSATRQEKSDTPGRVKAIGGHWVVGKGGLVIWPGNWWLQEEGNRQLVSAMRQAMGDRQGSRELVAAGRQAIGGCRRKAIGNWWLQEEGNRQLVAAGRQARRGWSYGQAIGGCR